MEDELEARCSKTRPSAPQGHHLFFILKVRSSSVQILRFVGLKA